MQNTELEQIIVSSVEKVLNKKRAVSNEVHSDHHAFIEMLIDERKVKNERNEKLKTQVYGWGIIVILGSIGTAVYQFFFAGRHI